MEPLFGDGFAIGKAAGQAGQGGGRGRRQPEALGNGADICLGEAGCLQGACHPELRNCPHAGPEIEGVVRVRSLADRVNALLLCFFNNFGKEGLLAEIAPVWRIGGKPLHCKDVVLQYDMTDASLFTEGLRSGFLARGGALVVCRHGKYVLPAERLHRRHEQKGRIHPSGVGDGGAAQGPKRRQKGIIFFLQFVCHQ